MFKKSLRALLFPFFFFIPFLSSNAFAKCNVVKVGNEGFDFSPHYYFDSVTGKKTGFEIDLLDAVFNRLGKAYTLVDDYSEANAAPGLFPSNSGPIPFNQLIPGLSIAAEDECGVSWHMASAALSITEERLEAVDFSLPVNHSNTFLYGKPSSHSIKDIPSHLSHLKIGVEKNSVQEVYLIFLNKKLLKMKLTPIEIVPIQAQGSTPAIDVLFQKLVTNKVNLIVACEDFFIERKTKDPVLYEKFDKVSLELTSQFGGEKIGSNSGFAFPKNSSLLREVNLALQEIFDDCTYSTIFKKYFTFDNPLIPKHCL